MPKDEWNVREEIDEGEAVKVVSDFVRAKTAGSTERTLTAGFGSIVGPWRTAGIEVLKPVYKAPFPDWSRSHPDLGIRMVRQKEDEPHLVLLEFKSSGKNAKGDYQKTCAALAQGMYQAYCARASSDFVGSLETVLVTGYHPWLRGAFAYARERGQGLPCRHVELYILDGPGGRLCIFDEPLAPWEPVNVAAVPAFVRGQGANLSWFLVPSSGSWYGFEAANAPSVQQPRAPDLKTHCVFLAEALTRTWETAGWVKYEWDGREHWSVLDVDG